MKFTVKNKKVTFEKKESDYFLDEKKIKVEYCLLREASLTTEFAYLVVVSDKVYTLKSESWLKKQTDKENDQELVDTLNKSMEHFDPVLLKNPIHGILPTKLEKSEIYHHKNRLFSPQVYFDYKLNNVEVVFLERLTSYTRSFDLTIVEKNLKRFQITCIDRKKYVKDVRSIFDSFQVVETGPDPVEWKEAIEEHKNGVPWDQVYVVETEEDEEEEWVPGETDEETETDDEYEEIIPVMEESKKRKLDEKWEQKAKILHSGDYDNWEKKIKSQ